jgi:hypothetical protein
VLAAANRKLAQLYPGDATGRQPVHTLIGAGDAFSRHAARHAGEQAIRTLEQVAPAPAAFAEAIGLSSQNLAMAQRVYARVREKLEREPVEDFRIDFEDGYGTRSDAEEDTTSAPRPARWPRASTKARCRHSSGSASSPCRASSIDAAFARSISL